MGRKNLPGSDLKPLRSKYFPRRECNTKHVKAHFYFRGEWECFIIGAREIYYLIKEEILMTK
jgi:hypothetical protein